MTDQAHRLETLLRDLLRRLFVLRSDDPAFDLPVTQLRVLGLLQREEHTLTGLSEGLGCSVSAATQIADRMEAADLVRRVPDPEDRRCKRVELTERGREVVRRRSEMRAVRAAEALAQMPPERREAAMQALEDLLAAATALPFGEALEEVQP